MQGPAWTCQDALERSRTVLLPSGVHSAAFPAFLLLRCGRRIGSLWPEKRHPASFCNPEESLIPDTDPEEGPIPDTDPEEGPIPDTDPEEGPIPDTDPEEGPSPDTDPEEGPSPDTDPEEGRSPGADKEGPRLDADPEEGPSLDADTEKGPSPDADGRAEGRAQREPRVPPGGSDDAVQSGSCHVNPF
ncbi:hypothetical protein P7K49_009026 [Saguinus oedipus]|uniref:Uncharacterized protein n=1 Tax=Saguinus oedipus TaxID=9490 RepID=A0ABQ9W000_SAGOE|nr:hypothetical protein P7K49_009026 [Saguinus oedipus]